MTARKKINRKANLSAVRKRRQARKHSNALNFEMLESRQLLAAITVGNATDILSPTADTSSIAALVTNDGGDGISLREAVTAANNTAGEDAITFDGDVFTGGSSNVIRLTQGELVVSESLSIDGLLAGSVFITGDADGDDTTLPGSIITDVTASFGGTAGAASDLLDDNSRVLNFSGATGNLTLTGLIVTGGSADGGGGILFDSSGELSLTYSTVSGNSGYIGGGISTESGSVSLFGSTISDNSNFGYGSGGGIYTDAGDVSITNSTISGNSSYFGGGINTVSGRVSVIDSTIKDNDTIGFGGGGGIYTSSGVVSLTNSTISGNNSYAGGGINAASGSVYLTNSTISGNDSSGFNGGGGILTNVGSVSITNSTISGNSGGGISVSDLPEASLSITNSIVAENYQDSSTETQLDLVVGSDLSLTINYSLIGVGDNLGTISGNNGNLIGTQALPLDPLLGRLADNGGPTMTQALLSGSPAINAGSDASALDSSGTPLATDQRGQDRFIGTIDLGAVEFSERRSLVVTTSLDVENPTDGRTSLREAIAFANDPTAGTIVNGDADGDGSAADTITFDDKVFTGETGIVIRLTQGELAIGESLSIDGSSVGGVLISGDANGNDVTIPGTAVTDVSALGGGANDNSRVLNFSNPTGNLTLTNLTITGGRNSGSLDGGGGIRFASEGALTLIESTISGNRNIGVGGGGISSLSGNVFVTNSTISGNSSSSSSGAGGIYSDSGFVSITNSTVSNNIGGGVAVVDNLSNSALTINNSIVAGNYQDSSGVNPLDLVVVTDLSLTINHSLIGVGDNLGTITGNLGNLIGTQAAPLDPLLGPLSDNGGPTLTQVLLPGSPAIDTGNNALALGEDGKPLATDQLGQIRIVGAVDIGAVETPFDGVRSLVVTTAQDIVNPSDGFTSLREAIEFTNLIFSSAGESDTITFDASVFTGGDTNLIRLTQGELPISDSLIVDGSSVGGVLITGDANGDDVTVDGADITDVSASFGVVAGDEDDLLDDNSRVINFFSEEGNLTLTGLTLTGGRVTENNDSSSSNVGGGGIRFNSNGSLAFSDVTVSGNSSSSSSSSDRFSGTKGGGILSTGGDLSFTDSIISGNSVTGFSSSGGGIATSDGDVTLFNSTVSLNFGGGIDTFSGVVSLTNSTVSENSTGVNGSRGNGGGIDSSSGDVLLSNSSVSENLGGGIRTLSGIVSLINNSSVSQNVSSRNGGGIYTYSSNVTLRDSTVSGNVSSYIGGGINARFGTVSVSNSTVSGNVAVGSGGGIFTLGDVTLINSTVSENSTTDLNGSSYGSGGGINSSGKVTLFNSTVSGNSTLGTGGGIRSERGEISLVNSTVNGNTAAQRGGGIYGVEATINLTNSTLSENTAGDKGGGIYIFAKLLYGGFSPTNLSLTNTSDW